MANGDEAPERIFVESSGVSWEVVGSAPLGLLIAAAGVAAVVQHSSVFTTVAAVGTIVLGVSVLVSCAYSLWGSCELLAEDGGWVITYRLGRWRRTRRLRIWQIHSVFLYHQPGAAVLWPGGSGLHVRVALERIARSVPIGSGLHAPRELLERVQAMLILRNRG